MFAEMTAENVNISWIQFNCQKPSYKCLGKTIGGQLISVRNAEQQQAVRRTTNTPRGKIRI